MMNFLPRLLTFGALLVLHLDLFITSSYHCGTRKHGYVQLVSHGWQASEGQWPWHVAVFHRQPNDDALRYFCGGSLLSERHLLTVAHCVVRRKSKVPLPVAVFELHLGQQNLSTVSEHVQVRDVSKVHVHPEYATLRNDVALLVMRLAVTFTDYVIPICVDRRVDRDLRNLEGQRGWFAGWGMTETGNVSDGLLSASLPVVSYLNCTRNDPVLFGNLVNETVFCAGELNGTSPGPGDSGGGMYFYDGDRWVLRGMVSFAKVDPRKKKVDTSKYAVFANVQRYLTWIMEVMAEEEPQAVRGPKRISEKECDRFREMASKRRSGDCSNARHPHSILISYSNADANLMDCNGALISENFAITTCLCVSVFKPTQVRINTYGSVDILEVQCHPEFDMNPKVHDLAVVKVKNPVRLSSGLIPACLASNWTENLYDTLVQTGAGTNKATGARQIFESDENEAISYERCKRIFGLENDPITRPGDLCVINSDPLQIRLGGVLGTPLQSVNQRTCMSTLVGVLQFTITDPTWPKDKPWVDAYTRISYYLDWIEQVVWGEESLTAAKGTSTVEPLLEEQTRETSTSSATDAPFNTDFVFPDQLKKMRASGR